MDRNIVTETDRLVLRAFELDDFDALFEMLSHPEVMEYSLNGSMSKTEVREVLQKYIDNYNQDRIAMYAVVKKDDQSLIGICGIYKQLVDEIHEYEIGYRLNRKYWGKGYATEAAIAVKQFGFNELQIDRFISIIEDNNVASKRVAIKNGMTVEKKTSFKGFDVLIYSCTR